MATSKKRINITLTKEAEEAIEELAKKDRVPQATKAAELLEEALALHEDLVLGQIAEERLRDAKRNKEKTIPHEEVWKRLLGK